MPLPVCGRVCSHLRKWILELCESLCNFVPVCVCVCACISQDRAPCICSRWQDYQQSHAPASNNGGLFADPDAEPGAHVLRDTHTHPHSRKLAHAPRQQECELNSKLNKYPATRRNKKGGKNAAGPSRRRKTELCETRLNCAFVLKLKLKVKFLGCFGTLHFVHRNSS